MLFSPVFACTEPRSAATPPRTVLTSLPTACTPPRGSKSHRKFFRINTYKSLSKQTTLTVVESHSYKKHRGWGCYAHPESADGGGVDSRFRPCRKGFFSRPVLRSLFAQRAFHNSLATKWFQTPSRNCRVSPTSLSLFLKYYLNPFCSQRAFRTKSHFANPLFSIGCALFHFP